MVHAKSARHIVLAIGLACHVNTMHEEAAAEGKQCGTKFIKAVQVGCESGFSVVEQSRSAVDAIDACRSGKKLFWLSNVLRKCDDNLRIRPLNSAPRGWTVL